MEEEEVEDRVYLGESSNSLPTRTESHHRDYGQDIRQGLRRRRQGGSEEQEGAKVGISSWMADHTRECHNATISENPRDDYEFTIASTFKKPLPRQVDEYLRIERAERCRRVKLGKEVWRVKLPLLNRKHEYWAPRNVTYTFTNYNKDVT